MARRATLATECGTFREAVARGSDGYLAVYAASDSAIVAVIGTSSLNVGMPQYRARGIIERIAAHSSQIGALAAPVTAAESARPSRSLPRRRPRPPQPATNRKRPLRLRARYRKFPFPAPRLTQASPGRACCGRH